MNMESIIVSTLLDNFEVVNFDDALSIEQDKSFNVHAAFLEDKITNVAKELEIEEDYVLDVLDSKISEVQNGILERLAGTEFDFF